jgi:four helix bundle protein
MTNDGMPNDGMKKPELLSSVGSGRRVYDLAERSAVFAEAVIEFVLGLPRNAVVNPLITQIVKSGTSVGANYCEADDAVSKKEFILKIGTCRKESRETRFWLRMIAKAVPSSVESAAPLHQEADELHRIFSAIRRRALGTPKPQRPNPKG